MDNSHLQQLIPSILNAGITSSAVSGNDHERLHEYSYVRPQQPHITVPPPPFTDNRDTALTIGAPIPNPNAELNIDFLIDTDYQNISSLNLPEWQYKDRREAQSILPFLYLGPSSAAKDKDFLRKQGITMVLGIQMGMLGSRLISTAMKAAEELEIVRDVLQVDSLGQMLPHFAATNKVISRHLAWMHHVAVTNPHKPIPPGKVLVFCESGNEKSPTIVSAFLMATFQEVDALKAMQICHTRRFCCSFDDTSKNLLLNYWDLLRAEREVGLERAMTPLPPPTMPKRGRERDEDDMDDDEEMDNERFEGRDNAPFR